MKYLFCKFVSTKNGGDMYYFEIILLGKTNFQTCLKVFKISFALNLNYTCHPKLKKILLK